MDVSTVIGILATLAVAWLFIRPSKSARREKERGAQSSKQESPPSSATSASDAFHWPKLGDFDFEVVGESNYQKTLAALAGDHGDRSANLDCIAYLVPEDDNRHDPKAVSVQISGRTVGYLTRENARSFRRRLGQKGLGGRITSCDACIVGGGTRKSGEKLFYGVKLDLKPFE
jgi:hypothetical protein